VSVGADNSYGHPSPPVLRRLADNGARVLRTDLDGDIAIVSTSDGLSVVVTENRPVIRQADSVGPSAGLYEPTVSGG
jgi:competence protein ComEC